MKIPSIKICGIATPEALDAAIEARAEFVGFNFYPPSPRYVTLDAAAQLGTRAAGKARRVGVFVNPDEQELAATVATGALDALQLHGDETPAFAAALRQRHGLPVWKVLPVAKLADIERARTFEGAVDFILFDAKTPKGAMPGGMGLAFDWALLAGWNGALPWGLAGGLSPRNVSQAIRVTRASMVDAASGIESAPGIKDPALIAAFCAAARSE